MSARELTIAPGLDVVVAEDHLRVWLRPRQHGDGTYEVTRKGDIISALETAELLVHDELKERIDAFLKLFEPVDSEEGGPPEIPELFLIEEAKQPVEAEDARFDRDPELFPPEAAVKEDETVDHFRRNAIRTIPAGVRIGRIIPSREGAFGISVYGNSLPPRRRQGREIALGPGLRHDLATGEVFAEVPGRLVQIDNRLILEEALVVPGDVSFESGNIDAGIDVHVQGTIRANFSVITTRALRVEGAVEAANVTVGGDAEIRGGLVGNDVEDTERGRVEVGGTLTARFCEEMIVKARGAIVIEREVLNSHIVTEDKFMSPRATVLGGFLYAREGIELAVLGSEAGVMTVAAVGASPLVLRRCHELRAIAEEQQRCAAQIREKLQPFLANLKRLSSEQREKATELLSRADEMELKAEASSQERAALLKASCAKDQPFMQVHRIVHAGARLLFDDREVSVSNSLQGPIHIAWQKEGGRELVAVNSRSGNRTILPSAPVDLESLVIPEVLQLGDQHEAVGEGESGAA